MEVSDNQAHLQLEKNSRKGAATREECGLFTVLLSFTLKEPSDCLD